MRDIETGMVVLSRRDKRERVKKRTRELNLYGGFVWRWNKVDGKFWR